MKSVNLLSPDEQRVCFTKLYAIACESQILVLRNIIYQLGVEQAFMNILSGCEPMKLIEKQVIYNALHYIHETRKNN